MRRESGKQRAARIPLDYFKTGNAHDRWKWRLSLVALVVPAWAIGGLLPHGPVRDTFGETAYSRGPVATVHATWDTQCNACHVPFAPLSQDASWTASWFGVHATGDAQCQKCHPGPPHNANQKADEVVSCGSCHAEHRGRDASLLQMADTQCIRCHADLSFHLAGVSNSTPFQNVAAFDNESGHPEFKRLRGNAAAVDPGKLNFNHALHLRAGLARTADAQAARPFVLNDIFDKADRRRYGWNGSNGNAAVQLDCAACHQLSSEISTTARALRGDGAYMLPIVYAVHCRACHRLGFDPSAPELEIPHRLQPEQVRNYLWGAYAERAEAENAAGIDAEPPASDASAEPQRSFPGKDLRVAQRRLRDATARGVNKAENFLFRKELDAADKLIYRGKRICGECHVYEEPPADAAAKKAFAAPQRIVPPNVPGVRFEHARFDHKSHRAMQCRDCHAQATTSETSGDILLPRISTCVKCHAPHDRTNGELRGGARFHCTECHRYHHG